MIHLVLHFCIVTDVLSDEWWHISMPVNRVIISSGNGLAPVQCQASPWIIDCLLSTTWSKNKLQWNSNRRTNSFFSKNAFEYIIWKMYFPGARPYFFWDRIMKEYHIYVDIDDDMTQSWWWNSEPTGIILYMHLANEEWRYKAMSSLIGLVHTQKDPWAKMDGILPLL